MNKKKKIVFLYVTHVVYSLLAMLAKKE